jgi:hypothetical protein
MVTSAMAGVYSDRLITATELNRQPGRVLDLAWEHPVTITRNDKHFALLPREDMACLVKAATQTKVAFEMINIAYRLRLGEPINCDHAYGWLKVFDNEELSELIAEVESAFKIGSKAGVWDALEGVIHEWHESAIAVQSSELAEAFSDKDDEVPLTQPTLNNSSKQA